MYKANVKANVITNTTSNNFAKYSILLKVDKNNQIASPPIKSINHNLFTK